MEDAAFVANEVIRLLLSLANAQLAEILYCFRHGLSKQANIDCAHIFAANRQVEADLQF